jgi:hypothetical protein
LYRHGPAKDPQASWLRQECEKGWIVQFAPTANADADGWQLQHKEADALPVARRRSFMDDCSAKATLLDAKHHTSPLLVLASWFDPSQCNVH